MNLEYKVLGYYFQRNKKGFFGGHISFSKDNKIVGIIEDNDYKDDGKRFVIGLYERDMSSNLYFIKSGRIKNTKQFSFIYSLTKEDFSSENFEGKYKGFWIPVESNFEGETSEFLGIPGIILDLKEIFSQEPSEKSLKK